MYFRVNGDSTQNRGVQPDIRLPSAISPDEVGESARDGALNWRRIPTTEYRSQGSLGPILADLQRSHDERVLADPDFRYTVAEYAAMDELRREKSVSLNLKVRQAERETQRQEQLARENARRSAHGEAPLKSADELKDDPPDAVLDEAANIAADLSRVEPRYLSRVPQGS
jgi:carboxyl-terminal processing protease